MLSSVIKYATLLFLITFSFSYAQSTYKTGEMIISASPEEIMGADAMRFNSIIKKDAIIEWEVYVPENYDPNRPAGLMVYAGAPQNVRAPFGWMSVMKDKNMIWVAARKSGNGSSYKQKELLTLMSAPLIERDYKIDPNRVYISGEGRIASVVIMDYPEIFKGAILSGYNIWSKNPEAKVEQILDKRFVFVTRFRNTGGIANSALYSYNKFKEAGVKNINLVRIQGRFRYDRRKFLSSIEFLDQ